MLPYVIWTPFVPFSFASGGILALNRLCHELNEAGAEAYMSTGLGYREWKTPPWQQETKDFIAVYPEIAIGNPLGAKHVVRWILYPDHPQFDETDYVIAFSCACNRMNLPPESILCVPTLELDLFCDLKLPKVGRMFYVGSKGLRLGTHVRYEEVDKWPELCRSFSNDRTGYARIIQTCEVVYSYDNFTFMTDIARLCGAAVVMLPNGTFTKEQISELSEGMNGIGWGLEETDLALKTLDSSEVKNKLLRNQTEFPAKLNHFIQSTQRRFA